MNSRRFSLLDSCVCVYVYEFFFLHAPIGNFFLNKQFMMMIKMHMKNHSLRRLCCNILAYIFLVESEIT